MRVTSAAGTDLTARLDGAFRAGSSGIATEPGTIAHWPGGLCLAFPAAHCVEGVVVLAPGDINLTFKTYVREAVTLRIEDDHIVAIEGDGLDADLFRSYLAAFGDRESYAVSHVGFGMNRAARWDYLELYDKAQINGTEARAFAGNFLFSTGANENAGRYTAGHFDLPMRGCTVALDGQRRRRRGRAAGRPGLIALHHLGADALAQQREHVVGLRVAADHLLEEDALAVDVDVEDAARARAPARARRAPATSPRGCAPPDRRRSASPLRGRSTRCGRGRWASSPCGQCASRAERSADDRAEARECARPVGAETRARDRGQEHDCVDRAGELEAPRTASARSATAASQARRSAAQYASGTNSSTR